MAKAYRTKPDTVIEVSSFSGEIKNAHFYNNENRSCARGFIFSLNKKRIPLPGYPPRSNDLDMKTQSFVREPLNRIKSKSKSPSKILEGS